MQEPPAKLFTDSMLSDSFSTKSMAVRASSPGSAVWILGPIVVITLIALLLGMLICWWLRCSRRSRLRQGSMTKVALSSEFPNGHVNETSKLLLGTDGTGRPVMNVYEVGADIE